MKKSLLLGTLFFAGLSFCAGAEAATVVSTFNELRDAVKNPDSLDIQLGADITLTAAIPVSLDAVIDGNGKTLTAGSSRHFEVQSTTSNGPTFKNVTFKGSSTGGGVFFASGGKAKFEGGTFQNNRSAAAGGAVSIAAGAEAAFTGTSFTGNAATGNGGAVSVTGTGKATFSGTVSFSGNAATGDGGAVYLDGADVTFPAAVQFENNTAANGGAVALSGSAASKATFNGNVLSPNTATANGGSLYIPGSATAVFNADQAFNGNSAASGGAIWAESFTFASGRTLTFTNNSATADGGALYVNSGAATLSDGLVFTGNKAARGGAVYTASALAVSGGRFGGNAASESGGAIYTAGTVTVTGGTFEAGNKAEGTGANTGGGAIWAQAIQVEPSGTDSIRFSGQTAKKDGGALFSNTSLTAQNAVFSKNEAGGSGGAVLAMSGVTLTNTAFSENRAAQKGGALFAGDSTTITSSVFEKNASKGDGGAVALDKSTASFKMVSSAMLGNSAGDFANSGRGGALYLNLNAAELDRSTFSGNSSQSSTNGQGGAVRLQAAAQSTLTNCTFTGNTVTGNTASQGGALWLSGPFVLTFCTLSLENTAAGAGERLGGGLYLSAGKAAVGAVLAVGNKADFGADVYRGGSILTTGGYNRIARFGVQGSGAGDTSWANPYVEGDTETDRQQDTWTSATFFGSNVLADNSGPAIGPASATKTLQTLALSEADALAAADRAMDAVPSSSAGFPAVDQRGVVRPQPTNGRKDVGAFETEQSGSGTDPGTDTQLTIKSVRMSGIPNTLTRVGQTAALTATVVYANGTTSTSEKVTWSSSNPGVARIDAFGNIVALSLGRTVIGVTVNRQKTAADSATLEVREEMSYTNVHPEIWIQLGLFNDTLSAQGAGLTFADSDPSKVKASAFQKTFREAWGLSAAQVTALQNRSAIRFAQKSLSSGQGWSASKPAIDVSLGGRTRGDILPLKYRWSLSWQEIEKLLGRKATQVDVRELSGILKLAFASANGATYDVVGGEGVSAADAESRGALRVANGNNGLTLELTAFVADAAAQSRPQLVEGLLVIPDGTADRTISGALGLLQKPASGGGDSKGEGGGGCSAGFGGALCLMLAVPALLRKKH